VPPLGDVASATDRPARPRRMLQFWRSAAVTRRREP